MYDVIFMLNKVCFNFRFYQNKKGILPFVLDLVLVVWVLVTQKLYLMEEDELEEETFCAYCCVFMIDRIEQ